MTAIRTTSMTMTQTLSTASIPSPMPTPFVATLGEECTHVPDTYGCTWSKTALHDLIGLNSTIRESMRFSNLEPLTVARKVANKAGIDLNVRAGAKMHIPAGVNVCLPASSVHRDPSIYSSPKDFQPFRFAMPFSSLSSASAYDTDTKRDPTSSAIIPSPRFLAFGYGRHVFPGRFFVLAKMKLLMAYLLKHYDVEKLPERPADTKLFGTRNQNRDTKIRMRREAVVGM